MRTASDDMAKCELTCISRDPIDIKRLHLQHEAYEAVFRAQVERWGPANVDIAVLPAVPGHADCMFVEDVAIVTDDFAILTRPGVASRQGEVHHMKSTLQKLRQQVFEVTEPGTIDGGDTLAIGKFLLIGKSTRTNDEGFAQAQAFVQPFGYTCFRINVAPYGCMHLKCAITLLTDDTVLIRPDAADLIACCKSCGLNLVYSDPSEPDGANVLSFQVGRRRTVCVAAAYPKTIEVVRQWAGVRSAAGFESIDVQVLEVDEVAKAEGALTCCSLLTYAPRSDLAS